MKRLLISFLLCLAAVCGAQTYTEWYIQTTGDNRNSGHTSDDAATFTAASGCWTNNTGFGVFFKSALNPVTGGVTNGAWASVFPDGNTATAFVGIITNVDDSTDTIWVKNVGGCAGTAPSTDEASATTVYVGGAWKGPGKYSWTVSSNTFPFAMIAGTMSNGPAVIPCVNIKGTYNITNGLTAGTVGPIWIYGYTSTPRDGGFALIHGGGWGSGALTLMTLSGGRQYISNLEVATNGTTSSSSGIIQSGAGNYMRRCVIHDTAGYGLSAAGNPMLIEECEAYKCNTSGLADCSGFRIEASSIVAKNCISHDNIGDKDCNGFSLSQGTLINCISYNNGGNGFHIVQTTANTPLALYNCDAYSNSNAGLDIRGTTTPGLLVVQNCNFLKNVGMGITNFGNLRYSGIISYCGFGTGTEANASGDIAANVTASMVTNNLVSYSSGVTPWVNPSLGNFRISLAAAKGTGSSYFQQLVNSPTNTVGYPDIGASQSAVGASGGAHASSQ